MTRVAVWLTGHPWAWPVALLPVLLPFFWWVKSSERVSAWLSGRHSGFIMLATLPTAGYLWLSWHYAFFPSYADMYEPQVAGVSWYFWTGKPVYHGAAAAECYSMVYGPILFVFTGLLEGLLGPSIMASKIGGVLAANGALAGLFCVLKRHGSTPIACAGTGLFAALNLHFGVVSFWLRPEPYLMLFVALGYMAAGSRSKLAPTFLGIAMGVCVNLKFHAVLYFIPAVAWVMSRGLTRREVMLGALAAGAVMVLPFAMFPNISAVDYLATINVQARHGLDLGTFLKVMEWLFALLAPVAALWIYELWRAPAGMKELWCARRLMIVSVLAGGLFLAIPASKIGAGPHHYLPFTIALMVVAVHCLPRAPDLGWSRSFPGVLTYAVVSSWVICLLGTSFLSGMFLAQGMGAKSFRRASAVTDDIRGIIKQHGQDHVLLMGAAGDAERGLTSELGLTFQRPWLVFCGAPIGLDPGALMDYKRSGEGPPDLEQFRRGVKKIAEQRRLMWLVPLGGKPFSLHTYYPPEDELYGAKFQADFSRVFVRLESSKFYDLYVEAGEATMVAPKAP